MDRLSALFSRYLPTARVFYSGNGCRQAAFDAGAGVGHVHILHAGTLRLTDPMGHDVDVDVPSVIFYPHPTTHAFVACGPDNPELLCGSIDLGTSQSNPLTEAMPDRVIIPLAKLSGMSSLLEVMFSEAFEPQCGRQAALDHLLSYFLVRILRHLIDNGETKMGLMAGLSDPRLARALTAIHDKPDRLWTLDLLADVAGMSRARFAARFREAIGATPMDYVSYWRVSVVQSLLKQGYSLKQVASRVGYQSAAALSRTFSQRLGVSPRDWLQQSRALEAQRALPPGLEDYERAAAARSGPEL